MISVSRLPLCQLLVVRKTFMFGIKHYMIPVSLGDGHIGQVDIALSCIAVPAKHGVDGL
jgi:hypothetical protein